jgi:hypothetical protein
LAYMRSNMTLSKISRTKSMAVVCRVYEPDWLGCRVELSSGRRGCREADVVKQAWV